MTCVALWAEHCQSINGFLRWLGQPGRRSANLPQDAYKRTERCWLVGAETMQVEVNLNLPLTLQVLQGSAVPQEGSRGWRHLQVERNSSLCSHGAQDVFSSSQKSILLLLCWFFLLRKGYTDWWSCVSCWSLPSHTGVPLMLTTKGSLAPLHTGMAYSHYCLHSLLSFPSSLLKLEDWWKIIDLKLLYKILK